LWLSSSVAGITAGARYRGWLVAASLFSPRRLLISLLNAAQKQQKERPLPQQSSNFFDCGTAITAALPADIPDIR
jgi:hypothetical protein